MPISQVIGILGSLVGTTATLLGAWAYIRSKRPPKTELLIAGLVVGVILVVILGIAVLISRETNISINGQKTIPVAVPGLPGPSQPGPGPAPTSTPTLSPTSTPSAAPSPSTSPTASPSVSPTPVPTSPISTPTTAPATPKAGKP